MQFPYRKILILGNGGAGKSTFAADMGARFSLPVVHLDRLWWLPGWVNRSTEEFDALLADRLARPAWVMDGNYHRTLQRRLCAADAAAFWISPRRSASKAHMRARSNTGAERARIWRTAAPNASMRSSRRGSAAMNRPSAPPCSPHWRRAEGRTMFFLRAGRRMIGWKVFRGIDNSLDFF